jgi:hypothetical protein
MLYNEICYTYFIRVQINRGCTENGSYSFKSLSLATKVRKDATDSTNKVFTYDYREVYNVLMLMPIQISDITDL